MTRRESNRIVRWFRENVGLAGWEITVLPGLPPQDTTGDCGACLVDIPYHRLVIWVNAEAHKLDSQAEREAHTLLHELLHGHHAECGIIDQGEPAEWSINQLASNLLRLYRLDTE